MLSPGNSSERPVRAEVARHMDMSKLPRLSQTNQQGVPADPAATLPPPPPSAVPAEGPQHYRHASDVGYSVGAEVWISAILGVVFLFMGSNFARFAAAKLSGGVYHTNVNWTAGEKEGQEVAYFDLQGGTAYTESGIFLFGLALVLEALSLLAAHVAAPGRKPLVGFALFVTLSATAYNLFVAIKLFGVGIPPMMTIIAVAIGGYMAAYQWRLLKQVSAGA
jgi:hypothetical protein